MDNFEKHLGNFSIEILSNTTKQKLLEQIKYKKLRKFSLKIFAACVVLTITINLCTFLIPYKITNGIKQIKDPFKAQYLAYCIEIAKQQNKELFPKN